MWRDLSEIDVAKSVQGPKRQHSLRSTTTKLLSSTASKETQAGDEKIYEMERKRKLFFHEHLVGGDGGVGN
jgi:hypothetical protein